MNKKLLNLKKTQNESDPLAMDLGNDSASVSSCSSNGEMNASPTAEELQAQQALKNNKITEVTEDSEEISVDLSAESA